MKYAILSSLLSLLVFNACSVETDINQQTASHIARPAFMVERTIPTGQFGLVAWERMHQRGASANIYIEGDTDNMINKNKIDVKNILGADATPDNPVGLHLASRDSSKNLAYLSRPCQYVKNPTDKGCDSQYWMEERFSPEVIAAYDTALNDIKARWDITEFNIIGYGGGANIAAVLAATRKDIASLRTVAGDLNPKFEDNVKVAPVSAKAVLATNYGSALATIPQHHFIGAADDIVTPGTYHSYRQAVGLSDCIHYSMIADADHTRGWVEKWPELLTVKPQCAVIHEPNTPLPDLLDFPGNYDKLKGLK